jgi:outer membrane protein OmpA-like peptidoglycan-associated protein/ABC-type nitrate/sulfonate/bicarbonate transport system substrate-binding protein
VSKAKIFLVSVVWLILLTIGVLLYRMVVVPTVAKQEADQAKQVAEQQAQILEETSGNSAYKHRLKLGLDGFSGYAVLRSAGMEQQLRSQQIKIEWIDDGADYNQRLQGLSSGELQMAVFPIDALLKASQRQPTLPATIVALIDETRGADAMVAYKAKYPNVDALNTPGTQFVLVGDSPSETLVRLLMHDFQLDQIQSSSFVRVASEKEVFARYKQASPQSSEVFVTWEPVVSQILENDQLHVLIDSSAQSGTIVDALVVSRDFLIKNEPVVRGVLECYFRTLYSVGDRSQFIELVRRDASDQGSALTADQAARLVDGIVWKNTQENLAHFGLRSASVAHVEDMIDRIKRVLLQTGGLESDPTGGDSSKLFNEQAWRELQAAGFHPGVTPEMVREDAELPPLTDAQWDALVSVGTAQVPPLIYARGTARLTETSRAKLDEMVKNLKSWPNYYVMIRGNASSVGDAEANRQLAQQRAEAALEYLLSQGVPATRVRAVAGELSGQTSVTFVLGQTPY